MDVLVISTISVSSISVYFGLFWRVGPRFAPALAPVGPIDDVWHRDQDRLPHLVLRASKTNAFHFTKPAVVAFHDSLTTLS